jgi:hypothetical protein
LVARCFREAEGVGSNPIIPIWLKLRHRRVLGGHLLPSKSFFVVNNRSIFDDDSDRDREISDKQDIDLFLVIPKEFLVGSETQLFEKTFVSRSNG